MGVHPARPYKKTEGGSRGPADPAGGREGVLLPDTCLPRVPKIESETFREGKVKRASGSRGFSKGGGWFGGLRVSRPSVRPGAPLAGRRARSRSLGAVHHEHGRATAGHDLRRVRQALHHPEGAAGAGEGQRSGGAKGETADRGGARTELPPLAAPAAVAPSGGVLAPAGGGPASGPPSAAARRGARAGGRPPRRFVANADPARLASSHPRYARPAAIPGAAPDLRRRTSSPRAP